MKDLKSLRQFQLNGHKHLDVTAKQWKEIRSFLKIEIRGNTYREVKREVGPEWTLEVLHK